VLREDLRIIVAIVRYPDLTHRESYKKLAPPMPSNLEPPSKKTQYNPRCHHFRYACRLRRACPVLREDLRIIVAIIRYPDLTHRRPAKAPNRRQGPTGERIHLRALTMLNPEGEPPPRNRDQIKISLCKKWPGSFSGEFLISAVGIQGSGV